jgi:peptidoglycan/xylan/chitin deacetylase (PgdA/CDA1 family)
MDVEPDIGSKDARIELFQSKPKLDRFARIVNERRIPITAFVATRLLAEAPRIIDGARAALPMRFEVHSHRHDQAEPDSEREIDASLEAYLRFFEAPPRGYRAPNGLITADGLRCLASRGFAYDSSIFPSVRFDEYGYSNLSYPIEPFVHQTPAELLEIPIGVIRGIRLVTCMSYIKLLGLPFYDAMMALFGVPDILVFLVHPYDFTMPSHLHRIRGWKRHAHRRNADHAEELFFAFIERLRRRGYRLVYMDQLLEKLEVDSLMRRAV